MVVGKTIGKTIFLGVMWCPCGMGLWVKNTGYPKNLGLVKVKIDHFTCGPRWGFLFDPHGFSIVVPSFLVMFVVWLNEVYG